jgi:hypothetical protein
MKKLFTLLVLLTCFLGTNAKEIVDAEVDFSTMADGSAIKFYGWGAADEARARLSIKNGCLHFESTEAVDPGWACQFHPIGGFTPEVDVVYTLHFKVKGSVAQNISALGFGQTPYGQFPITTEWVEGTFDYTATVDGNGNAPSGDVLFQCGDYVGEFDIAYLKITHEGKEQRPVTWQQWITNDGQSIIPNVATESKYMGDAEFGNWPDWALANNDEGYNINWRGDRTGEICAWALTMGTNFQPSVINDDSDRARPYPCPIEADPADPTNHVFAVHVKEIAPIDDNNPETDDAASVAWSNQFWLQSPQGWKSGTQVKIKFRYKASTNVSAGTQVHKKNPSDYLYWNAVGDVNFTTEWQEFDKTITFDSNTANGWSLAFNLNSDETNGRTAPIDFYFDDLSWETMVLDEGLFVASSNSTTGIEYDFDTATEFVYDEESDAYVATVGTVGKKDTWVNEVMISTIRGNDTSFKGATIKPAGTITGDDEDNWQDYVPGSSYKIKLPAAGVWKIFVAPVDLTENPEATEGSGQILFMKLEGEAAKEPVDIVTNPTVNIVHGQERQPTAAEQPADEEAGTPAGTGQVWDNQFFIVANRTLQAGEETVIRFKYKASKEAKTSTQAHNGPGQYVHWGAIGDVTFTTEWQDFEKEYTIPNECDGTPHGNDGYNNDFKSFAFNMAEIKDACDYEIKDVQWFLKADINEQGKTPENLINATGDLNFYVKEGAGTNPYVVSGIFNITNTITGSDVIYNLSGQRVSKDYKGIVIKNGRKYVVK